MRFIVIEGPDGAGKDTQAILLAKYLQKKGSDVLLRSHPSWNTVFGKICHASLYKRGHIWKFIAAVSFILDLLISVFQAMKFHGTVIFVRYIGTSIYFPQPMDRIVFTLLSYLFRLPDVWIYIDVPPKECMKRIRHRKKYEMFENIDEMTILRKKAHQYGVWIFVDGRGSIEDVHRRIVSAIKEIKQD